MLTKVQKWGNSQGLRIPKAILEDSHITVGDEVDISVHEGNIIIKPVVQIRGRHDIKDLVARMPRDYKPEEIDWGPPVGKEEW